MQLQWRDAQGMIHTSDALNLNDISLDQVDWEKRLGLALYQKTARIGQVLPNSVAEKAGIQANDELVGINGTPTSGNRILDTIHANPNQSIVLTVHRQNQSFNVNVVPQAETLPVMQAGQEPVVIGRIGVQVAANFPMVSEQRGLLRAAYLGLDTTIEQIGLNLKGLYKVLTGHLSVKNIGGPVTIAKQAGNSAQNGYTQFLGFLAVLSVSLGTLNLLPIPVLDGGHLVYYAAEVVRGKPLPEKVLIIGQKIGLILLLMLMGTALLNDMRWFT
jgi:regulator of sigma E protease